MSTSGNRGAGGRFLSKSSPSTSPEPPSGSPPEGGVVSAQPNDNLPSSDRQALQESQVGATETLAPPIILPPPPVGADPEAPFGRRKDGSPAKKRGARSGARHAGASEFVMNPSAPDFVVPGKAFAAKDNNERYRSTAEMMVGTITGAMSGAIPEWPEPNEGERKFLNDSAYEYIKAKQLPDLPPGWVLLAAIAMYALPRIQKNNFLREKLGMK